MSGCVAVRERQFTKIKKKQKKHLDFWVPKVQISENPKGKFSEGHSQLVRGLLLHALLFLFRLESLPCNEQHGQGGATPGKGAPQEHRPGCGARSAALSGRTRTTTDGGCCCCCCDCACDFRWCSCAPFAAVAPVASTARASFLRGESGVPSCWSALVPPLGLRHPAPNPHPAATAAFSPPRAADEADSPPARVDDARHERTAASNAPAAPISSRVAKMSASSGITSRSGGRRERSARTVWGERGGGDGEEAAAASAGAAASVDADAAEAADAAAAAAAAAARASRAVRCGGCGCRGCAPRPRSARPSDPTRARGCGCATAHARGRRRRGATASAASPPPPPQLLGRHRWQRRRRRRARRRTSNGSGWRGRRGCGSCDCGCECPRGCGCRCDERHSAALPLVVAVHVA